MIAPAALAATDGAYQDVYYVNGCASGAGIFSPTTYSNMSAGPFCPDELETDVPRPPSFQGSYAEWSTITPSPSIRIIGVTDTGVADCNLHHDGFLASYFYGDNGVNYGAPQITIDGHGAVNQNGYAGSLNEHIPSSRYFGWSASCNAASCTPTGAGVIVFSAGDHARGAGDLRPRAHRRSVEHFYYQSGWVKGAFPADLSASDPSGVCLMQTTVNGRAISTYVDPSPDHTQWTQCHGSEIDASVDTTAFANGAGTITLAYAAANAAGAPSTATKSINVDNATPARSACRLRPIPHQLRARRTWRRRPRPARAASRPDLLLGGRRPRPYLPGRHGAGPGRGGIGAPPGRLFGSATTRSTSAAWPPPHQRRPSISRSGSRPRQRDHVPRGSPMRSNANTATPRSSRWRAACAPSPPARQARPGARTGQTRPPARPQMPRPDRGPHRHRWCSSATANRCCATAGRVLCQAARAAGPVAPRRQRAHPTGAARPAHHGQRIPGPRRRPPRWAGRRLTSTPHPTTTHRASG